MVQKIHLNITLLEEIKNIILKYFWKSVSMKNLINDDLDPSSSYESDNGSDNGSDNESDNDESNDLFHNESDNDEN